MIIITDNHETVMIGMSVKVHVHATQGALATLKAQSKHDMQKAIKSSDSMSTLSPPISRTIYGKTDAGLRFPRG